MKVNGKLVKDDPEFMSIFDQELNPELNLDKGITIGSTRRLRYRKPDGSIAEVSIGHLYRAKQRSSSGTFDEYIGRPLRRAVNDDPEFMSIFDPELNPDIAGNLHRITTASRRSLKYRGSNGAINAIGIAHLYSIRGRFGTLSCCLEQHERHYAKDDPEFMSIFDPELNPDLAKDLDSITTGVNRKIRFRLPDGEICERTIEQLFRLKKKWGDFSHMRTKKRKHVKDDPEFMLLFDPALNPDLTDRIKKLTTGSKVKIRYRCNGAIMEASIYSLYQAKRRTGDFYKHRCVKRKPPVTDDAEFMDFLDQDLNPGLCKVLNTTRPDSKRCLRYLKQDGSIATIEIWKLFSRKRRLGSFEAVRIGPTNLVKDDPEFMSLFDPELNPGLAKDLDSITTGVDRKIRFRLPDGEICERKINQLFRLKKKWGDFSHMRTKKIKYVKDDPEFMLLFDPALNPDLTDRIKKLATGSKVKIRYRCNGAIMEASIYSLYQAKRRTGDFYKHRCVKRKPPVTDDAEFMNFLDRDLNPELLKDIDRITAGTDRIIRYRDLDGFVRECPISELFALKKQGRPFESLRNTTQLLSCAPELRDYIVSDLSYVAKHRPTSLLKVECVCPLCGAHFTKSISALVTGLYKCPACHDTGVDERKMVEGNFYLI